ncbi:hypothetical protein B0H13DRAFT_1880326 [Mycena leptocephala]|nr:hypothetical protein B0H13DRAFT_1880326 [Mycena leptocephala]
MGPHSRFQKEQDEAKPNYLIRETGPRFSDQIDQRDRIERAKRRYGRTGPSAQGVPTSGSTTPLEPNSFLVLRLSRVMKLFPTAGCSIPRVRTDSGTKGTKTDVYTEHRELSHICRITRVLLIGFYSSIELTRIVESQMLFLNSGNGSQQRNSTDRTQNPDDTPDESKAARFAGNNLANQEINSRGSIATTFFPNVLSQGLTMLGSFIRESRSLPAAGPKFEPTGDAAYQSGGQINMENETPPTAVQHPSPTLTERKEAVGRPSSKTLHRYIAIAELCRTLQESVAGHEFETMRQAALKSLKQIDMEEVDKVELYGYALSLKSRHSPSLLTKTGEKAIDGFEARWEEASEKDKDIKRRLSHRHRRPQTETVQIKIRVFLRKNDLDPTKQALLLEFSQSAPTSLESALWRLNRKFIKEKRQSIVERNPHFYRMEALDDLESSLRNSPFYLEPIDYGQSFRRDVQLVVFLDGYWQIWLDTAAPRRFCNIWKLGDLLHNAQKVEPSFLDKELDICRDKGDPQESLKAWMALLDEWYTARADPRSTKFSIHIYRQQIFVSPLA